MPIVRGQQPQGAGYRWPKGFSVYWSPFWQKWIVRPPNKSNGKMTPRRRGQNVRFAAMVNLVKLMNASDAQAARERAAGTGYLPRDIQMRMTVAAGFTFLTVDNEFWEGFTVAAESIQALLDSIVEQPNAILVRGPDAWLGLLKPSTRAMLIYDPTSDLVAWDTDVANVQTVLDQLSPDVGAVIFRTSSGWVALAQGDPGDVLTCGETPDELAFAPVPSPGAAGLPHPGYRVGPWYTQPVVGLQGKILANSTIYAHPFFVGETVSFDEAAIRVNGAAGAGSKFHAGVYANDPVNHCPGALLHDFGEGSLTSTGDQIFTGLSLLFDPGELYWLAVSGSIASGTATVEGANGNQSVFMAWWLGHGTTNTTPVGYQCTSSYGPLPDPWPDPTPDGVSSQVPLVYLRKTA